MYFIMSHFIYYILIPHYSRKSFYPTIQFLLTLLAVPLTVDIILLKSNSPYWDNLI